MSRSVQTEWRSLDYLEGQAAMAAEVAAARDKASAAETQAVIWRRRHRNAARALFCAVAVQSVLAVLSVILWLMRRGA